MKVTLNWLKQYLDFNWSPEELTERLTLLGLEIKSRLAATEWRQIVAHSASCGLGVLKLKAPEGRQKTAVHSLYFFRPAGAGTALHRFPRLAPWATTCRRFTAKND